jgi:hypothetical protein
VLQPWELGDIKLLKISHFFSSIGFARFPSDGAGAESVSAEWGTEHIGGRAPLKTELPKLFPVPRSRCKTSAAMAILLWPHANNARDGLDSALRLD